MGALVELIEVGEPRPLTGDRVQRDMKAASPAGWDEFVRTGGRNVDARASVDSRADCHDLRARYEVTLRSACRSADLLRAVGSQPTRCSPEPEFAMPMA
ncbi:MAG TPA: hypothetical protein VLM11_11985 [Streptosporangiaceae bacterium]|nr:hypothetical protein [Streptosporangiaceae bacterium]